MSLEVSTHDEPEVGAILVAVADGEVELVLGPEERARQVAYLVSGLHGTPMWQVLDLQNLVVGCTVRVVIELDGMTLSNQVFSAPVDFPRDPALTAVAADSVGEDDAAGVTPPAPVPPKVAQPPKDGENDAMAGGAG